VGRCAPLCCAACSLSVGVSFGFLSATGCLAFAVRGVVALVAVLGSVSAPAAKRSISSAVGVLCVVLRLITIDLQENGFDFCLGLAIVHFHHTFPFTHGIAKGFAVTYDALEQVYFREEKKEEKKKEIGNWTNIGSLKVVLILLKFSLLLLYSLFNINFERVFNPFYSSIFKSTIFKKASQLIKIVESSILGIII